MWSRHLHADVDFSISQFPENAFELLAKFCSPAPQNFPLKIPAKKTPAAAKILAVLMEKFFPAEHCPCSRRMRWCWNCGLVKYQMWCCVCWVGCMPSTTHTNDTLLG